MPFLTLLQINWKPTLCIVLALFYTYFVYNKGADSVRSEWQEANAKAMIEARTIEQGNVKLGEKIGGDYEKNKSAIISNFNDVINGLQFATSGDMSSKSEPTSKPNATTSTSKVCETNKRKLIELGLQAELNTEQLIQLQEWIRESK
jgi:hypothetical protein